MNANKGAEDGRWQSGLEYEDTPLLKSRHAITGLWWLRLQ